MTKEEVREALSMTIFVWDGELEIQGISDPRAERRLGWVPLRRTPIILDAMGLAQFLSTCYTRVMVKRGDEFLFYAHEGELRW